jgi:hypothetical protein
MTKKIAHRRCRHGRPPSRVVMLRHDVDATILTDRRAEEYAGCGFVTSYCKHPACRLRARTALRPDTANLTPAEAGPLARSSPIFRLEPPAAPGQGGSTHTNQRGTVFAPPVRTLRGCRRLTSGAR